MSDGLTSSTNLPQSDTHGMTTTVCVADIGLKGQHMLVVGTYGQQLLMYKQVEDGTDWELEWSRSLLAPVLGVRWVDMTGDGLRELVVITGRGVHVLQSQLDWVKDVLLERLRKLIMLKNARYAFS